MRRQTHPTRPVRSPLFALLLAGIALVSPSPADQSWPAPAVESLPGPVLLPDGTEFSTWHDTTEYTRVYYVDTHAENASDENDGSAERPLKTIQRAAELVEPGEKVVIREGRYRECVRPVRGGLGPDRMIAFQAARGATVVISGSGVYKRPWVESRLDGQQTSKTLWMSDVPDRMFDGANPAQQPPFPLRKGVDEPGFASAGNPFRTPLASERDISIMPWAAQWAGKIPYRLPRGLVFGDRGRMVQMATYKDLLPVPGSYWVEPRDGVVRLHIHPRLANAHPRREMDPNQCRFELTVHQQLFKPAKRGLGYIKIKGLVFEHAAGGFPRSGVGAVTTHGGHHWIIENNEVRECGSVGIEIGARTNEFYNEGTRKELEARTGYHVVRGNTVHRCGTGGIQGHTVFRSLVEQNHILHCGWQDVERYWETAAVKMLLVTDTVVRKNYIHDVSAACGIWLDFLNVNCRVTRNVIRSIRSYHGGIFIEASQVPNLVDTNIIFDIEGHGVYQHDTDRLTVANNLIVNCRRSGIHMQVCQNRMVGGRISTCKDNRAIGNVLIHCRNALWFLDDQNVSEHNVIAGSEEFDLEQWRTRGLGKTDVVVEPFHASLNRPPVLTWSSPSPFPEVPRIAPLTADMMGAPYGDAERIAPGPFRSGPVPEKRVHKLQGIVGR